MIFVTVGTHEQPFNRLVEHIDKLKGDGVIQEEVIMQTGYSTYEPRHCKWQKLFPYTEMIELVKQARIVITHGGPSSFIMPLQIGKVPIVVPRKKEFGEHVNDHQVEFAKVVHNRQGSIILVENVDSLKQTISDYNNLVENKQNQQISNNTKFCHKFSELVEEMLL